MSKEKEKVTPNNLLENKRKMKPLYLFLQNEILRIHLEEFQMAKEMLDIMTMKQSEDDIEINIEHIYYDATMFDDPIFYFNGDVHCPILITSDMKTIIQIKKELSIYIRELRM